MLLVFPALGWAIRGLVRLQLRLMTTTAVSARATSRAVASRESGQPVIGRHTDPWRRVGIVGAAFVTAYTLALLANTAGIGDNVVWLPRDLLSGLTLTVALSPVIAAAVTIRRPPVRSGVTAQSRLG
jgi:hypothetical protein